MILTEGQVSRASRVAQLRLAWALGLRGPNPTAREIAFAANAHHYPPAATELSRRADQIAKERGISRTRALYEARRQLARRQ